MKAMSIKRTLVTSGLTLGMMVTMLAGASLAWFNQTIVNQGARIQSGTLTVEFLSDTNDDFSSGTTNLASTSDPIFQFGTNAQPGDFLQRYLRITNTGSISMHYDMKFDVVLDTGLGPAIVVEVEKESPSVATQTFTGVSIHDEVFSQAASLDEDEFETYRVKLTFDSSAGNEFQNKAFNLDLYLVAYQASNDASQPIFVSTIGELQDAATNAEKGTSIVFLDSISASSTSLAFTELVNLNLRGFTLTLSSLSVTSSDFGFMRFENGIMNLVNYTINTPSATLTHVANLTMNVSGTTSITVSSNTYVLDGVLETGSFSALSNSSLSISGTLQATTLTVGGTASISITGTVQATTLNIANTASVIPQATSTLTAGQVTGGSQIVPVTGATLFVPPGSVTPPAGVTVTAGTMITNATELLAAVRGQNPSKDPDVQTIWYIASGEYDVAINHGNISSFFVIREPNLKIIGLGNPVIFGYTNNGNGSNLVTIDSIPTYVQGQNTLTVHADKFHLEGVTIYGTNWSGGGPFEVAGAGAGASGVVTATLQNNTFTGFDFAESGDTPEVPHPIGGQVKINPLISSTKDTIKILNNTFDGSILDLRTPATITGNHFKTVGALTVDGIPNGDYSSGFAIRFRLHALTAHYDFNSLVFANNTFNIAAGTVKIVASYSMTIMTDTIVSVGGFTEVSTGLAGWLQGWRDDNIIRAFN
jgi:hypothetical protein